METKKNNDGSYVVVLGNSSVRNKNGLVFPPDALRNTVFKLNERAKRGTACAELGFPARPAPHEMAAFFHAVASDPNTEAVSPTGRYTGRVLTVDPERICARFTDFRVEDDNPQNPRIVAKVVPLGPHAEIAREALEGKMPAYFGARALTDDKIEDDMVVRHVKDIITFDLVSEPA